MVSDSIANVAVPGFCKDIVKKKRTNRLAKLKQSKLDIRREQWLSQVKNKGTNAAPNEWGRSSPQISVVTDEGNKSSESSVLGSKEVDIEVSSIHESDLNSLMSSPVGSSNLPGSSCSSASSRCCSSSVSETDEDDGCLDDWEAVADALIATEKHHEQKCEPSARSTNKTCLADPESPYTSSDISLQEKESRGMVSRAQENSRAWRADDASHPQCLPNLLKQNSQKKMSSRGAKNCAWQSIVCQPSSCPICYEDLDLTDSSFLPCPCGFSLCLFCHKRILEADARCPGCRKQYDHIKADIGFNGGDAFFRMGQSFSMSTRLSVLSWNHKCGIKDIELQYHLGVMLNLNALCIASTTSWI